MTIFWFDAEKVGTENLVHAYIGNMSPYMKIEISETTVLGEHLVRVCGALSLLTAHELRSSVNALLQTHVTGLKLDLSGITHIDTGGLIALLTLRKQFARDNRKFTIDSCSPAVSKLISESDLESILFTMPAGANLN